MSAIAQGRCAKTDTLTSSVPDAGQMSRRRPRIAHRERRNVKRKRRGRGKARGHLISSSWIVGLDSEPRARAPIDSSYGAASAKGLEGLLFERVVRRDRLDIGRYRTYLDWPRRVSFARLLFIIKQDYCAAL